MQLFAAFIRLFPRWQNKVRFFITSMNAWCFVRSWKDVLWCWWQAQLHWVSGWKLPQSPPGTGKLWHVQPVFSSTHPTTEILQDPQPPGSSAVFRMLPTLWEHENVFQLIFGVVSIKERFMVWVHRAKVYSNNEESYTLNIQEGFYCRLLSKVCIVLLFKARWDLAECRIIMSLNILNKTTANCRTHHHQQVKHLSPVAVHAAPWDLLDLPQGFHCAKLGNKPEVSNCFLFYFLLLF